MNPRWFIEADPVFEIMELFDDLAAGLPGTLEKKARASRSFFESDQVRGAYFDLKMYAVTFSF